jgi:basic membrane lipoprotein Med (substrate-binding protein (PBP1-ABC) superfamily)
MTRIHIDASESLTTGLVKLSVALVSLVLFGCTRAGTPNPGFRVALITPGSVSDAGWNASAFKGLELIRDRLGAGISLVQTASPADFEDVMRGFASRGVNLVFAHGFEYTDAALTVGRSFPATTFVVTSGAGSSTNVASVSFRIEEATWVEGVLAGGISRRGVVGEIGGINIPQIAVTFGAFKEGFLSVRPDGKVLLTYTGSFNDVGAAKEAALAEVGQGADLLLHDADQAGLGVFQAAVQSNVFAFGIISDQAAVAPDNILASAVAEVPLAFLKIATQVKAHDFRAKMIEYGMRDGMVRVVYNTRLIPKIPAAALARARRAELDMAAGRLSIETILSRARAGK